MGYVMFSNILKATFYLLKGDCILRQPFACADAQAENALDDFAVGTMALPANLDLVHRFRGRFQNLLQFMLPLHPYTIL